MSHDVFSGSGIQELSLDEIELINGAVNWDVVAAGAATFSAGCFGAMVFPPAGALAMSVGLHMAVAGALM